MSDKQHFYKYRLRNGEFLKDGHTMFLPDVLSDLQRKSFLEENKLELESQLAAANERIKELEQTCLNEDAVEFVKCGIGINYGGRTYIDKLEEVYKPIKALYDALPPQPKGE